MERVGQSGEGEREEEVDRKEMVRGGDEDKGGE